MAKLPTTQKVFDVVGEGRTNDDGSSRQDELTACEPGEAVELVRQPKNEFDRNAIFVRSCRSIGIGYLSAEDAAGLAPAIDAGRPYAAKLHALTGGLADYPHYGAKVSIAWDGRPEHPHRPLDASQLASRRGRQKIRGRQRDAQGRLLAKEQSGCAVVFIMGFVAIVLILFNTPAIAAPLSGVGKSIDGDSLSVGSTEVRLHGIDAPEFTQTCQRDGRAWGCGSEAAFQLSKLVDGKQVDCTPLGADVHGRTLARCRVGETDLNRTMVAMGYALAYRRYSMAYVSAEASAKLAKRGIWTGTFELPSQVRHAEDDYVIEQPAPDRGGRALPVVSSTRSKPQPSGGCRIKGNHSRKGELIYHLPGMPYYAETRAEQIFCTEAEARAAGYRRSRADQHR